MTLPTFLVIGAQKAGTTALYELLCAHPQVFVPRQKEPGFFIEEVNWHRGLDWYESLFAEAADATAIGEASTSYTMFPAFAGVPERIARVLPDVRLIYTMRDPVERMRSAYAHALANGTRHRSIDEALLTDARFADASRYAMQIEQYLRHFDRSQLLLLFSDDIAERPAEVMRRVFSFLGVDAAPADVVTPVRANVSAQKRVPRRSARVAGRVMVKATMLGSGPRWLGERAQHPRLDRVLTRPLRSSETALSDDLRARLEDLLAAETERLRDLVGDDIDRWSRTLSAAPVGSPG